MANNRTEFKTQVTNLIKAIVSISKHRQTLNDELADSINFRKDVKSSTIVATASANSIDFTSNDLVTIDGATNNLDLVLTITNTEDGEDSKYIRVIKDADNTVSFSGATDITFPNNVTSLTTVIYQVYNKNGVIYAKALTQQDTSVYPIVLEIGDWNMDSTELVGVTHGVTDYKKIRSVDVVIRNDTDTINYKLPNFNQTDGGCSAGVSSIDSTLIIITRLTGGAFDDPLFDSTGYNRGHVTIWLEP